MFRLSVVTPERPFLEQECRSLVLPGTEGYLGVLTDHAPLLTALVPGELRVTGQDGVTRSFAVAGGFCEVARNHVTVLAEAIEEPGRIDVARAQEALDKARRLLAERPEGLDLVRAHMAVARAKNRLEQAEKSRTTR